MESRNVAELLAQIREQNRRVIIIGLGITGLETARALNALGFAVCCTERQQESFFRSSSNVRTNVDALRQVGVELHFEVDGERVLPLLDNVGLAVLSPGVPLESSIVGAISRMKVPFISELELGIELHGGRAVVVTGSNGKSTTASLIHHILVSAEEPTVLCGKRGIQVIAADGSGSSLYAQRTTLVIQASSYQLESCTVLRPAVSILLNVSDNHLERHGSLERYAGAMSRGIRLQNGEDVAIFNADDPLVSRVAHSCSATVVFIGRRSPGEMEKLSPRWAAIEYAPNGRQDLVVKWDGAEELYDLTESRLLGLHNRYNIAAAVVAARALCIAPATIQSALSSFKPLEHCLEFIVDDERGVVVNDSGSTTVAATVAAFATVRERYPGKPLTLLIGGLSKAGSWDPLLSELYSATGVTSVVCFGKDGPLLASHCSAKGIESVVHPTLQTATGCALSQGWNAGSVVLLSPGCASFDEFTDFAQRGLAFRRYVTEKMQRGGEIR